MANIKVKDEGQRKVTVAFSLPQCVRESFEVECNLIGINKSHKAQELLEGWIQDQVKSRRDGGR